MFQYHGSDFDATLPEVVALPVLHLSTARFCAVDSFDAFKIFDVATFPTDFSRHDLVLESRLMALTGLTAKKHDRTRSAAKRSLICPKVIHLRLSTIQRHIWQRMALHQQTTTRPASQRSHARSPTAESRSCPRRWCESSHGHAKSLQIGLSWNICVTRCHKTGRIVSVSVRLRHSCQQGYFDFIVSDKL